MGNNWIEILLRRPRRRRRVDYRGHWRKSTLLLLALGASACARGALVPTTTPLWCNEGASFGTESATLDGNAWSPVRVAAVGLIGAGPLEINASDCRRIFNIVFANNPGPGTYTLANGVTNVLLANEPGSAGDNLVLPSGQRDGDVDRGVIDDNFGNIRDHDRPARVHERAFRRALLKTADRIRFAPNVSQCPVSGSTCGDAWLPPGWPWPSFGSPEHALRQPSRAPWSLRLWCGFPR